MNETRIMPPKIIIGLTGPIGSGCSTLATFFDDPNNKERMKGNKFLQKMVSYNFVLQVQNDYVVNWSEINKQVDVKLNEYHLLKTRLEKVDEASIPEKLKFKRARAYKELGRLLDQRESLKAFCFLKPYYPKEHPHYFRTLSMSDLIIFHCLLEIERNPDIATGYDKFAFLAKKAIGDFKVEIEKQSKDLPKGVNSIALFYEKICNKLSQDETKKLIRVFKIIHTCSWKLKKEVQKETDGCYVEMLQSFGNNIRKCGSPFTCSTDAGATASAVKLAEDMSKIINLIYDSGEAAFFVIDCLRNPYEVLYFRQKFPAFYLVSIYASKEVRVDRVYKDKVKLLGNIDYKKFREDFDISDELDSGKTIQESIEKSYKQDVTKCVQLSDYAINNLDNYNDKETVLHLTMLRMMALILSHGSCKPTLDEVHMNMAYAMAVKSNCICRQVGAIITGSDGYILGAGWNDVASGEISCGLRALRDVKKDENKIHEHIKGVFPKIVLEEKYSKKKNNDRYTIDLSCFCFKDEMVTRDVTNRLTKELNKKDYKELEEHKGTIDNLIKNAGLHQLEFCRALHAEENAIVQSAKIGGAGIKGGTIFTTAQPCTLCSKKIKQSGIVRVVYTDPYPKSLPDIFMDEVELVQFEGVKPRNYMKLFMPCHDSKEWQDLEVENAVPGFDFNEEKYLYEIG